MHITLNLALKNSLNVQLSNELRKRATKWPSNYISSMLIIWSEFGKTWQMFQHSSHLIRDQNHNQSEGKQRRNILD